MRSACNIPHHWALTVGERAGSGVPDIFSVWENEGWVEPRVEEQYKPDRTTLILSFDKRKPPKKTADKKPPIKTADKKPPIKTMMQRAAILEYLAAGQWAKASEINSAVGVSDRRLRELLQDLVSEEIIVTEGENRWRKYKIRK